MAVAVHECDGAIIGATEAQFVFRFFDSLCGHRSLATDVLQLRHSFSGDLSSGVPYLRGEVADLLECGNCLAAATVISRLICRCGWWLWLAPATRDGGAR
jgi:hypothetical protein